MSDTNTILEFMMDGLIVIGAFVVMAFFIEVAVNLWLAVRKVAPKP